MQKQRLIFRASIWCLILAAIVGCGGGAGANNPAPPPSPPPFNPQIAFHTVPFTVSSTLNSTMNADPAWLDTNCQPNQITFKLTPNTSGFASPASPAIWNAGTGLGTINAGNALETNSDSGYSLEADCGTASAKGTFVALVPKPSSSATVSPNPLPHFTPPGGMTIDINQTDTATGTYSARNAGTGQWLGTQVAFSTIADCSSLPSTPNWISVAWVTASHVSFFVSGVTDNPGDYSLLLRNLPDKSAAGGGVTCVPHAVTVSP